MELEPYENKLLRTHIGNENRVFTVEGSSSPGDLKLNKLDWHRKFLHGKNPPTTRLVYHSPSPFNLKNNYFFSRKRTCAIFHILTFSSTGRG